MKKILLYILYLVIGMCSALASTPYEVTAKTSLNIRSAASPKSAIIGKLYSGERIDVVSVRGSWAEITYKGKSAYVSTRYISALPVSEPVISEETKVQDYPRQEEIITVNDEQQSSAYNEKASRFEGVYRFDTNNEIVRHYMFYGAQYNLMSFKSAKTSMYGVFLSMSSISHWGTFHLGAELSMGINAGILDDWGIGFDFGPSMRFDISDNIFVNIPINARVAKAFIPYDINSGESAAEHKDSETNWGAVIKPSLYFYPANFFGIYIGPQLTIFKRCDFGMQTGFVLEL